jgi:UDP-2,4-diacetamido-2,4,6-trideoxy-beta-L-altropyranose hydrolase
VTSGKIIIRCDGSSEIGLGHVMRCLALTDMLKDNFSIAIAISKPENSLKKTILKYVDQLIELPANGFNKLPSLMEPGEEISFDLNDYVTAEDIVVTDGYWFGTSYQQAIKKTGAKLVCIDDFARGFFYADAVINHAPGMKLSQYKGEPHTRFYLGLDYALLRKEFFRPLPEHRSKNSLLISLGGSDPLNITIKALKTAYESGRFNEIHVMVSSLFSNDLRTSIEEFALRYSQQIKIHSNLSAISIVDLMDDCSHALVSASTILLECYSRGLICFAGYYTENQMNIYNGFVNQNLAYGLGNLNTIDSNFELPEIDSGRVIKNMAPLNSNAYVNFLFNQLLSKSDYTLRKAEQSDSKLLFDWANDPDVRINAINTNKIEWASHHKWFKKRTDSKVTKIFILEENQIPVGQVRFDSEDGEWMIDYSISRENRGRGLGPIILVEGMKKFPASAKFVAFVKPSNSASVHVFERLAFKNNGIVLKSGLELLKFTK